MHKGRLEAPMEIMSFRQGNKFPPSALISTMLTIEKEKVNYTIWFSQKLQNEIIAIKCKTRKIGNTLAEPTLTSIGHYLLKQWKLEKKSLLGPRKRPKIGKRR